jgi:LuxR family transcriptional regulator, maltose regulon positive regulatory protein
VGAPVSSLSVSLAYRFAPPRSGRPLLRRSALLRRLQQRWEHSVTVIVAGAGFGKSSLLAQAVGENALAPRGDDCWLGCGPGDDDARRLADGLATTLDLDLPVLRDPGEIDPAHLGLSLAAEVWQRSPRQVCLLFDDVHEIGRDSAGASLVAGLVDALPSNGHVVLSGRQDPPLPLARLTAQGRVERMGETDLAFSDEELGAFAALRDVSLDRLRDLGGWPALAELRTAGWGAGVDDFLAEEVLATLGPGERRAVATVAALGGADQALVDAVVGEGTDLSALMGRLPLVSTDEAGWYTVHPLWSDHLSRQLDAEHLRRARRVAGRALAGHDLRLAVDLLIAAGADDDLRSVLRTGCRAQSLSASAAGLGRLHSALPDPVRSSPEGALVAGIAASATDLDRATELLTSAMQRFAEAGDDVGLLSAVEHLAICAHWREDIPLLAVLWGYAERLSALPEARGLMAIGAALMADTGGDARGVLASLDTLDPGDVAPYWRAPVAWLRASAQLALGFPEAARRNAEAAVADASPSLRGALMMAEVNALDACGATVEAGQAVDRMLDQLAQTGNDHNRALGHTVAATHAGLAGRIDEAERHLATARQHAGPSPRPRLVSSLLGAAAAIALGRGDEAEAARLYREQLGSRPVTEGRARYGHLRRLPLLYVLLPETRAQFAEADLGPSHQTQLRLASALVALREQGDLAPAATLPADAWVAMAGLLPEAWTVELATAAAAGGRPGASTVVTDAGPKVRPALTRVSERSGAPKALTTWARTLLDAVPPEPESVLELSVLGPTVLRRDGRLVDHPHWRRERVRALLLVLVARGGGTREELAGALWPDLDGPGGLRNLRVTLSYLVAVMEPDRREGAPPFFVRSEGASLRLASHGWLVVDAREFDDLCDRAAEADRMGEPSGALESYRRALRLYHGPYLSDAGYEEWALPHRDRLSARFVAAAVRAGELTLAAGNPDEALRLAARALEAEPWAEDAHRLTVASHLARGDRAAARRAMHTCLAQLDDLGVKPTEVTETVLRRIA